MVSNSPVFDFEIITFNAHDIPREKINALEAFIDKACRASKKVVAKLA